MDNVTQADREAAVWISGETHWFTAKERGQMIQGHSDDNPLVKAFASHRLSALADDKVTDAVVEDAARIIAPHVCQSVFNADCDDVAAGQKHSRSIAKAAILAALAEMRGDAQ